MNEKQGVGCAITLGLFIFVLWTPIKEFVTPSGRRNAEARRVYKENLKASARYHFVVDDEDKSQLSVWVNSVAQTENGSLVRIGEGAILVQEIDKSFISSSMDQERFVESAIAHARDRITEIDSQSIGRTGARLERLRREKQALVEALTTSVLFKIPKRIGYGPNNSILGHSFVPVRFPFPMQASQ